MSRLKHRQRGAPEDSTQVWREYERGRDYVDQHGLRQSAENCYNFYEGKQWVYNGESLKTADGQTPPSYNIIEPTINQKVATVAMQAVSVHFSPQGLMSADELRAAGDACDALSTYIRQLWEEAGMDNALWRYTLSAAIVGYVVVHINDDGRPEEMDGTNVFFADEQELDIQKQPYIIIRERRQVDEVRRIGRDNGLPEDELANILPDEDTDDQLGEMAKTEVEADPGRGKCTVITKLWRDEDGVVCFCSSTRLVMYQPVQRIEGLTRYPIAILRWKERKGSARGRGEVEGMIPAQMEINRLLARRANAIKTGVFPHIVYNGNAMSRDQVKLFNTVGSAIELKGSAQNIRDVIQYLVPPQIGNDAQNLQDELINRSMELRNAGNAALGNINPEQASGAAIVAARSQAEIPLNWQKQAFKQFCEDLGRIWYALIVAYNPNGLEVISADENGSTYAKIGGDQLRALDAKVRVDVSNTNPVSRLASEQSLYEFMQAGMISFDEFVESLDDDSNIPKAKLEDILQRRAAAQQAQMMQPPEGVPMGEMSNIELPPGEMTQERNHNVLQALMAG